MTVGSYFANFLDTTDAGAQRGGVKEGRGGVATLRSVASLLQELCCLIGSCSVYNSRADELPSITSQYQRHLVFYSCPVATVQCSHILAPAA
jgi:hypothetical protein